MHVVAEYNSKAMFTSIKSSIIYSLDEVARSCYVRVEMNFCLAKKQIYRDIDYSWVLT